MNASSNTKQRINCIFKTLNDNFNDYINVKKNIISILTKNNECISHDVCKSEHLQYKHQKKFIEKYLKKQQNKKLILLYTNKEI